MRNILIILAVCTLASVASAQADLTNASNVYTQNFDTLPSASGIWADNTTIPAWYSSRNSLALLAGTGSSNTGGQYSFGQAADRALGSIGSGSTSTVYYGVRLRNMGTSDITSLQVNYTGEQWRCGGNTTQHVLAFARQVGATTLTTGTWTSVAPLNFTGPIAVATAGALDGNSAANQAAVGGAINVVVAPNQEIWLRWSDPDDGGSDHGLALDNLTVTATFAVVGPVIDVTTPTALTTWVTGSVGNSVAWSTQGIAAGDVNVQISTTGAAGPFTTLTTVPYNGSPVNVAAPAAPAASAMIRVVHTTVAASDDSPAFNVISPGITVTNPTAATIWIAATSGNTVAWNTQAISSGNVDVQVSTTGAAGPFTTLTTVPYNASPVNVTAPASPTANALIRVSHATLAVSGDSATFNVSGPPPTVSAVYPPIGESAGGAAVTITGTNFTGATQVTFGAAAATNIVVVSPTSITCNAPAGSGNSRVTVSVTANLQVGNLPDGFAYLTHRLAVGDIFVIGCRTDAPDGFAFVPWIELDAGEMLAFTDKSFDGANFFAGENLLLWQAPAGGLAAGTVVSIDCTAGPLATPTLGTVLLGNMDDMSSDGDQVFVLQGSLAPSGLLFGVMFASSTSVTGWLTAGAASNTDSYLPATLNAAGANLNLLTIFGAEDNADYVGARTGQDAAGYKALFAAAANWRRGDDGALFGALDLTPFNILLPNLAPVNTVPGAQAVNEDAALAFTNGTLISISDGDAGTNPVRVGLSVGNGKVELSLTTGLTFVSGANDSAAMTFEGTLADINAALAGMTYTGNADYNGPDTLVVTTNDLGSTGTGGALTDIDNVAITVNAVNDAPALSLPTAQSIQLSGVLALNAASANGVSFIEVDAGTGAVMVTLTASSGTLSVIASGAVIVTGNASAAVQVSGTSADVNATLNGLSFTAPGAPVLVTVNVSVDDQGNTGIGGAQIDAGNFSVNVTPLPSITVPGATLSFTAAIGSPSAAQSYAVIGANLTSGIAVSATAPFEIAATTAGPFGIGLNLPAVGGTVFVRYRPASGLTHNGSIGHVNGSVSPAPAVNLSGQIFRITSASPLPEADVGITYGGALTVSGGVAPFNWTIMSGPAWLTITPNGALGGTPVVSDAGDENVTVLVTDSQNPQQSVTAVLSITVNAPPAPPPVQTPKQATSECSATRGGTAAVAVLAALLVPVLRRPGGRRNAVAPPR